MDIYRPLIVIGSGRSGSTLLGKILDNHPDITFHGETDFLVSRLWLEIWEDHFWFNWKYYARKNPTSIFPLDKFPEMSEKKFKNIQMLAGRTIANTVINILKVSRRKYKAWGYKEIWNGSGHHNYDWTPYDSVFPNAIWIHLVRNPFEFVRSSSNWINCRLSKEFLLQHLKDWTDIVKHSRKRKSTERFFEIRYEDLVKMPRLVLEPVYEMAGLEWHENCAKALDTKVFASSQGTVKDLEPVKGEEIEKWVTKIDCFKELISELGYTLPEKMYLSPEESCKIIPPQDVNQINFSEDNDQYTNYPQSRWKKKYNHQFNELSAIR